VAGYVPGP